MPLKKQLSDIEKNDLQNSLLTGIIESLYGDDEELEDFLENNRRYHENQRSIDYNEEVIKQDPRQKNQQWENRQNKLKNDFQEARNYFENNIRPELRRFDASKVTNFIHDKVMENVLDHHNYEGESFSADTIIEMFNKFAQPIRNITTTVENDPANNKIYRGYLQNQVVKEIKQNQVASQNVRNFNMSRKQILKEFANNISPRTFGSIIQNEAIHSLHERTTFDPFFQTDHNRMVDVYNPNKTYSTTSPIFKDDIKQMADTLRNLQGVMDNRSWYKKIFNKDYSSMKNAFNTAKQFLTDRGVDPKALDKYIKASDSKKERMFDELLAKSAEKVNTFNNIQYTKDGKDYVHSDLLTSSKESIANVINSYKQSRVNLVSIKEEEIENENVIEENQINTNRVVDNQNKNDKEVDKEEIQININ